MYKHKIVQGLADLVEKYGGGGKDPMMRAIWFGIKGQVPMILQMLDDNEEAVAEIRDKMFEMLDIQPEPISTEPPKPIEKIIEVEPVEVKASPLPVSFAARRGRKKAKPEPTAKAVVTIKPTVERASGSQE